MRSRFVPILLPVVLVAGCGAGDTQPLPTDAWVGRWNGPEGTYLEIAGARGAYAVTVKDLDAARTFEGSAAGERIEFQRDGIGESLRATNGDETGMKWLAGKTRCLTIKPGEGYCRD
jgi:hypothetical protein